MPYEPVQCPNCRSGDIRQLAPDSYTCEHCHTNFRWVDAPRATVVQKPIACGCGVIAGAFCKKCGQPLCGSHGRGRMAAVKAWNRSQGSREAGGGDQSSALVFQMLAARVETDDDFLDRVPEWVRQTLEKHGIPKDDWGILCEKCGRDWLTAVQVMWGSLRQEVKEGRLCRVCWSLFSHYHFGPGPVVVRCPLCGTGLCSKHGVVCERCQRAFCGSHLFFADRHSGELYDETSERRKGRREWVWLCDSCRKSSQSSSLARLWRWLRLRT